MTGLKLTLLVSVALLVGGALSSGGFALANTGTPEHGASARISTVQGCPPSKSLKLGSDRVVRVCAGEHPVNCLKRSRWNWPLIDTCGYGDVATWGDRYYYWGCGLDTKNCFPKPCSRAMSLSAAFYGSFWDFFTRVPVPITSAVPQAMILEKISDTTLALIFAGLHRSATWNVALTCGKASNDALDEIEDGIEASAKPHLSISIGKGILFAASDKATKAAKYADLIARAVTLQATRKDGYSAKVEQKFRFGFGKGNVKTVKSSMSISPTGRISLRITL